jgi:two-component system response regulator FlrC
VPPIRLKRYSWPGNVRELQNMVERALVLSSGDQLDAENFPLDSGNRAANSVAASALPPSAP